MIAERKSHVKESKSHTGRRMESEEFDERNGLLFADIGARPRGKNNICWILIVFDDLAGCSCVLVSVESSKIQSKNLFVSSRLG